MKRLTGVWLALVLALVLAATAGSALAENPHNPSSPPGNSGSAPGQQKKDEAAATTTTAATPAAEPAQAGQGNSDSAPGQEKKSSTAQTATAQQQSTAKASHTAADGSKQYGNGKSALEIAKQTKSSITINDLSEPGNSGKHKVTICHNGHLITVDVHALQAHARHLDGSDVIPATSASQCSQSTPQGVTETQSAVCGSVTTTTTSTKVQNGHAYGRVKHGKPLHTQTVTKTETTPTGEVCGTSTGQNSAIVSSVVTVFGSAGNTAGTSGGANGASTSSGPGAAGTAATGGVAGISASLGSGQQKGGVLGIAATRVKGALPFTGFALWLAVLIGASLLIGGIALRRRTRGLNTAT